MTDAELIWQIAIVRRDADGGCWLEFDDPSGCSKCSTGSGCGAALFSRLFTRPEARIPMPPGNSIPADRLVRVGLDARWLIPAAAATYLLPAIAFIAGAIGSSQIWPGNDPAALLSGVSVALVAGLAARGPMKSISMPRLALVELDQGLETGRDRGHFFRQGN